MEGMLSPARRWGRYVTAAVLLMGALLVINWQVATVRDVPSMAMNPTYIPRDKIVLDKLSFRLTGVHYGDVVAIGSDVLGPGDGGDDLYRRVIGLPNDTIECRDGHVYRNGRQLDQTVPTPSDTACTRVTVPANRVYVLGDDRQVAVDSRQLGPLPQSSITGRVLFRIWPPFH
jgi:signal peptidase I